MQKDRLKCAATEPIPALNNDRTIERMLPILLLDSSIIGFIHMFVGLILSNHSMFYGVLPAIVNQFITHRGIHNEMRLSALSKLFVLSFGEALLVYVLLLILQAHTTAKL